jgi:competence protein ComEC
LLTRLRETSQVQRTRWTTLQRGDRTSIDGVDVRVLHPAPPDWERQRVRNDDSIVIELRWKDVSFVFTGDIGRDTESEIAAMFEPATLRVLKVPHHGSLTSSSEALANALKPNVAVFSVGRSNNFGHPARAVLERYAAAGAAIYRTDQDGAVMVTTDGRNVDVSSFAVGTRSGSAKRNHEERKTHEGHESQMVQRGGSDVTQSAVAAR